MSSELFPGAKQPRPEVKFVYLFIVLSKVNYTFIVEIGDYAPQRAKTSVTHSNFARKILFIISDKIIYFLLVCPYQNKFIQNNF